MKTAYVNAWKFDGIDDPVPIINQQSVPLPSGVVTNQDIESIACNVIGGNADVVHIDYCQKSKNIWAVAKSADNPDLRVQIVFHEIV